MNENSNKNVKQNKSVLKITIIITLFTAFMLLLALYVTNSDFRLNIDKYVFRKELYEDNLPTIEINSDHNPSIYAYSSYITVLSKNKLNIYNSSGKEESSIDVVISSPLYSNNNRFLALAEKGGQKFYLISDTDLAYQQDVEGQISRISVNKNGYVSVIVKNTTSKSIILVYNSEGKLLFKNFLAFSYGVCADISKDNKYLAFGEIDYSGTSIKSTVKVVDIATAQTNGKEAIIYKYEADPGQILVSLKYQEKDNVICMFNNCIQKVTSSSNEKIMDLENTFIYSDIDLNNEIINIKKQSSGLFSYEYELNSKNTSNGKESLFILNGVPKNIILYEDTVGINLGSEVEIVSTNGWLIKNYTSKKEVKNVVLAEGIAGIIYKDKIEIINF